MSAVLPLSYEVEAFSGIHMRENFRLFASVFLFLLILCPCISTAEDNNNNWFIEGGNSVLMEHYTATWCETCAQIDPWISDFADSRGSRLIRIALHDPENDPLGSLITSERLSKYPGGQDLAPSFWFDSSNQIQGLVAPIDLDRALLNSESNRDSDTKVSISVIEGISHNSLDIVVHFDIETNLSNSQASIFLLVDQTIDNSLAVNGITQHEDVPRAYVNIEILANHSINEISSESNFNSGFSNVSMLRNSDGYTISLNYLLDDEDVADISIVAAHELTIENERSTIGATALSFSQYSNGNSISFLVPLLFITIISLMISLKGRFL